MKKGWKVVLLIVLIAAVIGIVCIGVGLLTGAEVSRIKEILDNEYKLSAYFNWFIESMKIIYAWFVDLIGNGI